MVLTCTGRPGRSHLCDMNLVNRIELCSGVAGQHARETGREPGTHDDCASGPDGSIIECEQVQAVVHRIAHRHHMGTEPERLLGCAAMPCRRRKDDNIGAHLGPRAHTGRRDD